MDEKWSNIDIKGFEDWQISNYGRYKTGKGKIKSGFLKNYNGYKSLYIELKKVKNGERERVVRNIAQLVYLYFAKEKPKYEDFKVYHIDGNPLNNRIDNLKVSITENCVPNGEQLNKFNKEAYRCIVHYLLKNNWLKAQDYGLDIDGIIQESALMVYKHLHKYKQNNNFYAFCKKYTKFCAMHEHKKHKERYLLFER